MRLWLGGYGSKKDFLGDEVSTVLSIPYAQKGCEFRAKDWKVEGYVYKSICGTDDPKKAVLEAEAFDVPMGDTPRLLSQIYENDLFDVLREKIEAGTPFMGISAGTVILGPTIATTNDPIPEGMNLNALGVLPFHINPHYSDMGFFGESRIEEMQKISAATGTPVLGMTDGAPLHIEGSEINWNVNGYTKDPVGKLFLPNGETRELSHEDNLDFLLE